ncbi:MAG: hypothetical protein EOO75_11340 [Myxococcales bacterium]|nr:MAG: hypothetical protein EOO75_11340 [Myxococcales bacterium]
MNDPSVPTRASLLLTLLAAVGCSPASTGPSGSSVVVPPEAASSSPAAGVTPLPKPSPSVLGWVTEANGATHRASPTACGTAIKGEACRGDEKSFACRSDAECKEGPNGRCLSGAGQVGAYCGCQYACASDSDCKADEACVCADAGPDMKNEGHSVCAPARCRVDADCADTKRCGLSVHFNGCGTQVGLACRQRDDACQASSDCSKTPGVRGEASCRAEPLRDAAQTPRWSCAGMTCAIGRPLSVGAEERTATLARRPGLAWA